MCIKTKNNKKINDLELVRSFKDNNVQAYDQLVMKYKDFVFNICYNMLGDYDEADDCAQDVFIKVYNNLSKFKEESQFSTWLYRITINTCKSKVSSKKYKMNKKYIRIDDTEDEKKQKIEISDESYDPAIIYEKNETETAVHHAINSLPGSLKTMIILRDMMGKSYEEIADITQIKLGTVKSKLSRARRHLHDRLVKVFQNEM